MNKKMFKVKELATGIIYQWSMEQVLEEINRDRNEDWIPYNERDWFEGWMEWIEYDGYYSMIQGEIKC